MGVHSTWRRKGIILSDGLDIVDVLAFVRLVTPIVVIPTLPIFLETRDLQG